MQRQRLMASLGASRPTARVR